MFFSEKNNSIFPNQNKNSTAIHQSSWHSLASDLNISLQLFFFSKHNQCPLYCQIQHILLFLMSSYYWFFLMPLRRKNNNYCFQFKQIDFKNFQNKKNNLTNLPTHLSFATFSISLSRASLKEKFLFLFRPKNCL